MHHAVDVHGHAMPLPILRWLADKGLADLSSMADGIVRIDPSVSGVGRGAPLPLAVSMTDPARRIRELDDLGLAQQAVSVPPFLMASTSTDADLVREVTRRGNDSLVEYCNEDRARLLPLGLIPAGLPDAVEEARRCLDDMHMPGLAIGSRGLGLDLDDPANAPLWEFLADRRAFVFLHPSANPDPARLAPFWFPQLVGYPMETAIAAARLVFSGTVGDGRVALCLAHGGGCLPALRGRLDMGWDRKPQARTIDKVPSEAFASLYYDTAVFDRTALRRLIEDVGASQVLLGTDHPFDLRELDPIGFVTGASLSPAETEAVLSSNARRLLGLV